MSTDIKTLSAELLKEQLVDAGFPAFRAKQVRDWLNKGIRSFDDMANLPKDLRAHLAMHYVIGGVSIAKKWESALDETVKYLFSLDDG